MGLSFVSNRLRLNDAAGKSYSMNAHQVNKTSPDSPLACYQTLVKAGEWQPDTAQAHAIEHFEALYAQLKGLQISGRRPFWSRLFRRRSPETSAGIYLWGDVGRGKSMLMDLFYDNIRDIPKRRVHFHAFMRDVHARLHAWRQLKSNDDLLPRVVGELSEGCRLLCLDELQVHDVTDAMILSRLFTQLFDRGVVVVFTSNRPPQRLYQGGIQRQQFMQFIDLVKARMDIVELKSPTDYRLAQLKSAKRTYITPSGPQADEALYAIYTGLPHHPPSEPVTIQTQGRTLVVEKTACGVAWFTFAELCERPLGAADYLEIAREFHTVLVQDIPVLGAEKRNEAKRLVTLIDALYEHKVKVICTAAAEPEALYPHGHGRFEFQRTVSRLIEMQSTTYLSQPHIA